MRLCVPAGRYDVPRGSVKSLVPVWEWAVEVLMTSYMVDEGRVLLNN